MADGGFRRWGSDRFAWHGRFDFRRRNRCFLGRGRRLGGRFDVALAFDFNADQDAADRHYFTRLATQGDDLAMHRRRNIHHRLVGHDIGQQLVFDDHVADLDVPL
ncbi:hypothetical protein D3C75_1185010 [compost metagenome]